MSKIEILQMQRVDGELKINLPEGVTSQDFVDWLNKEPHRKEMRFVELPEKWTSADWSEEDD